MTPRTNSTIEGLVSSPGQLATRRIDSSDTFFGFAVMDSLRAWTSASEPTTLVAVYALKRGFIVGTLRFGESSRHAQYTLHRVGSEVELSQLIRNFESRGCVAGVCAADGVQALVLERMGDVRANSLRTESDLARFRKHSLRREDFFDTEFRYAMLQDAFDLGGLCSEQAVEIVYADLMTLMLSGPDVAVKH